MRQNGYQIDDLIKALTDLRDYLKDFTFSLDWTGEVEVTMQGRIPTVDYTLVILGRKQATQHPMPVIAAPPSIGHDLQQALGHCSPSSSKTRSRRAPRNLVLSRQFSEMLKNTLNAYHNRAIAIAMARAAPNSSSTVCRPF